MQGKSRHKARHTLFESDQAITLQDDFRHTPEEAQRDLAPLDAAELGFSGPSAGGGGVAAVTPSAWGSQGPGDPSPSGSLRLAPSPGGLPGETMDLATAMSLELASGTAQDVGGVTNDFDELARQEELSGVLMGEQCAGKASGIFIAVGRWP